MAVSENENPYVSQLKQYVQGFGLYCSRSFYLKLNMC